MSRVLLAIAALLLLPALAQAQQPNAPKIGVLTFTATPEHFKQAFRAGLREHGYVEGKSIVIEWRSADDQVERANQLAAELVRLKVNVIVASLTPAITAAKKATSTIPIVMAPGGDPVGSGFVASLAHPGGNITGITNIISDLGAKLLGITRELKPRVSRVAVLLDERSTVARPLLQQVQSGAEKAGIKVQVVWMTGPAQAGEAMSAVVKERAEAIIIQPLLATKALADLAIKHRVMSLSTGFASRSFAQAGGLIGYGSDPIEHYQRAATYVAKILKGANPADLPVEQPTKFELIINAKTAKAMRLAIPKEVLLRADEVVE
jgi:putative ABC transport system substrate-binding protein